MRQLLIAFALAVGAVGASPAESAETPRTAASPAPQAAAPLLLRRLPPSPRGSRL
jgi:hypothetical protein